MKQLNSASYAILKKYGLKWCNGCETILEIDKFAKNSQNPYCKKCHAYERRVKYAACKEVKAS